LSELSAHQLASAKNYFIIAGDRLIVLIIDIGNRRDIYRGL